MSPGRKRGAPYPVTVYQWKLLMVMYTYMYSVISTCTCACIFGCMFVFLSMFILVPKPNRSTYLYSPPHSYLCLLLCLYSYSHSYLYMYIEFLFVDMHVETIIKPSMHGGGIQLAAVDGLCALLPAWAQHVQDLSWYSGFTLLLRCCAEIDTFPGDSAETYRYIILHGMLYVIRIIYVHARGLPNCRVVRLIIQPSGRVTVLSGFKAVFERCESPIPGVTFGGRIPSVGLQ